MSIPKQLYCFQPDYQFIVIIKSLSAGGFILHPTVYPCINEIGEKIKEAVMVTKYMAELLYRFLKRNPM
jgi:hypothetical protein